MPIDNDRVSCYSQHPSCKVCNTKHRGEMLNKRPLVKMLKMVHLGRL